VRVEASWLGYTQTMTFELDGAPLGRVDVLTQDLRFAADGTLQVKLQAVPQTAGATVSTGTTLRCTVDAKSKVPTTVQVLPITDTRQVDGTGAATFTFVAGTNLQSVAVDVEAIPPTIGTTAPTSAKLSLTLLGPPAATTTTP
jgi:hypothetical protein